MKAAEVMSLGVATVRPDAAVSEAARIMLQFGVSGLPVIDFAGHLVGIVTEGDFLRRTETGTERKRSRWLEFLFGPGSDGRGVRPVAWAQSSRNHDPEVVTVSEDTPLQEVVDLMETRRIKRVPVVSKVDGHKVVGIISRANLVQALARLAEETPSSNPDDEAMRKRILAELDGQSWSPGSLINVIVHNGVAELWGTIFDERAREALRVAAENVRGIKTVKDHLVWVEPVSGMVIELPEDAGGSQSSA